MQTSERQLLESKLGKVGSVLRLTGWIGLCVQIAFGAISLLMVLSAILGRNFSQAATVAPGVPPRVADNLGLGLTPGIGVGIFWAVSGIVVLLCGIYFAFRQTRFAKRLRHADTMQHPTKSQVINILRLGVIVGLVGMLLTIIGGGVSLGVLFSKAIAQPQGVAIYDPTRIIRPIDVVVAVANISGIAAHFMGTVGSLSVFEWLHR
ncbi:MAG: DUF3611 family protein [Leptolyngbyaceae cyanobacterium CSU_1_4]|nr:DUF3611 family protein [Leptolyngbyaceae cyanobacterium CSU_1_4]